MPQASLFDTDDEPAAACPVSLARAASRPAPKKGTPLSDPDAPPVFRCGPNTRPCGGASPLERWAVAEALASVLADHAAGTASEDEVYRATQASLYCFSGGELVRVVKGLILVLRANHDGRNTGPAGEVDAGCAADGELAECEES